MLPSVTFCAHDFSPSRVGGPLTWILRLLPELVQRGIRVRLLLHAFCPPEEGLLQNALMGSGVEVVSARLSDRLQERANWFYERFWENPTANFVPNVSVAAYDAGAALRRAGVAIIGVIHSDDAFHEGLLDSFGFGEFAVNTFVVVSQFLHEEARRRVGADVSTVTIPCGVVVPERSARWNAEGIRAVYAGRLKEEQKRISCVTRALIACERLMPTFSGRIFGSGDADRAVRSLLTEHGSQRVVLEESVHPFEMQRAMLDAQVLLLLSDYEGLPIALMEAMACGLVPVVKKMRSGIDELIVSGESGFIVHEDSEVPVVVEKLLSDQLLWEVTSQKAREIIVKSYSLEVGIHGWLALLGEQASSAASSFLRPSAFNDVPLHQPNEKLAREDDRMRPVKSRKPKLARSIKRVGQSLWKRIFR